MKIKEVPFGSPEYKKAVDLRYLVLRKPLRLQYSKEDLAAEKKDIHVVGYEENVLVGVILLRKMEDGTLKMRQFAIHPDWQGQGLGSEMVSYCEDYALENGFTNIVLHARDTAVRFYEQLEYEKVGDKFLEVGIPHFKMQKSLED